MAGQNRPLWWASHHRLHHRYADTDRDIHSPGLRGLWWAHVGWIMCRKYVGYDKNVVRDLMACPELRLLGRYHMVAPASLAVVLAGGRRFATPDDSRNNWWVALLTLGEGWHNNHHRWPTSERQGFYWWELDISHYILKLLSYAGLVWDLRAPPARVYDEAKGTQRVP